MGRELGEKSIIITPQIIHYTAALLVDLSTILSGEGLNGLKCNLSG